MSKRQMTLRELATRLNAIVEENERRGWSDRNDKPVYLRLRRERTAKDAWIPVASAPSGLVGFSGNDAETIQATCIEGFDSETVKPTRERAAKIEAACNKRIKEGVMPDVYTGGENCSWVDFGKYGRTVAEVFKTWLEKRGVKDVRRGRGSGAVWARTLAQAELKRLVDEFMAE